MTINWRERFLAVLVHFAATLFVTGIAALLIFYVWFPGELAAVTGGTQLFLLVVGCDVVLGPLLSFVIYAPKKGRRKLVFDYCVVGILQLAAIGYGVFVVAESRPAFIVFNANRIDIVSAIELEEEELAAGSSPEFRVKSLLGPKLASVGKPEDPRELSDFIFFSATGVNPALRPKYYRPFTQARETILSSSLDPELLLEGSGAQETKIRAKLASAGKKARRLRWLPVQHRFGSAVALIDGATAEPVDYLAMDPTWVRKGAR